jgi:hypothetical protein
LLKRTKGVLLTEGQGHKRFKASLIWRWVCVDLPLRFHIESSVLNLYKGTCLYLILGGDAPPLTKIHFTRPFCGAYLLPFVLPQLNESGEIHLVEVWLFGCVKDKSMSRNIRLEAQFGISPDQTDMASYAHPAARLPHKRIPEVTYIKGQGDRFDAR